MRATSRIPTKAIFIRFSAEEHYSINTKPTMYIYIYYLYEHNADEIVKILGKKIMRETCGEGKDAGTN